MPPSPISGHFTPAFAPLAQQFARHFEQGQEYGLKLLGPEYRGIKAEHAQKPLLATAFSLGNLPVLVARTLKFLQCLVLNMCISQSALALEFMDGKCDYTKAELHNPDAVIELSLSEKKSCNGIYLKQKLYQDIELPHFGKWSPVYPEKAIRQLLKRFGVPKDEPFEPYSGTYREYKVRDKKPFPLINGHEAVEYTVELLYVSLIGWQHVPNSGPYGELAVCERSTVKLYAIKTKRGWHVATPDIGYSVEYSEQASLTRNWGREIIPRDMANSHSIYKQCKDRLN